jgi:hypothetical protein
MPCRRGEAISQTDIIWVGCGFVLAARWGVITVLHLWPYGFGINAAPFASRLIGRPRLRGKPDGGRHVAPR